MRRRWTAAAIALLALPAACTSGSSAHHVADDPVVAAPSTTASPTPTSRSSATSDPSTPAKHRARPNTHRRTKHPAAATPSPTRSSPARPHAAALPLHFRTAKARQVITVVAPSRASTQGQLQAWRKVPGGWRRVGPAVHAWLGSDGLTAQPSETRSATPIGSFTLTRAFGSNADPGTALPYRRTTPADWWISQAGPLYNTLQHCASNCSFTQGDPNEHLYYTQPYYRFAVVIDYNTRNSSTGVVQGAGSAFFLHVTVGAPTAGCVSVAEGQLVRLLRWLRPARHARILIGV
jgi:L,D-peptidoglycan transpeptidase YkuD (ErfK/YbiS/YcfS/YnhG family)